MLMITGDIIKIRYPPGSSEIEVRVLDDCFRVTDNRCTILVETLDNINQQFEIDIKEIKSGQDI